MQKGHLSGCASALWRSSTLFSITSLGTVPYDPWFVNTGKSFTCIYQPPFYTTCCRLWASILPSIQKNFVHQFLRMRLTAIPRPLWEEEKNIQNSKGGLSWHSESKASPSEFTSRTKLTCSHVMTTFYVISFFMWWQFFMLFFFNVDDNFEVPPGPSSSKKRFRIGFPNSGVGGAPLLPRKNEEE